MTAMRYEIGLWLLIGVYGTVGVWYLLGTCIRVWRGRGGRTAPVISPGSDAWVLHCFPLMAIINAPLFMAQTLPIRAFPWLLLAFLLCAIIRRKTSSGKRWGAYWEGVGMDGLSFFQSIRTLLLGLERMWTRIGPWGRVAGLGVGVAPMVVQSLLDASMSGSILFFLVCFFLVGTCTSLHSCRRLLVCWLVQGVLFAGCIVSLVPALPERPERTIIQYTVFTLVFTVFWVVTTGAADHSAAKMACAIVNTLTTILLVLITVLFGWSSYQMGLDPYLAERFGALQYWSVVILLPLVFGGYLAALLKEIQLYVEKKGEDR